MGTTTMTTTTPANDSLTARLAGRRRGFTLIELLITIGIIILILAMAVPVFRVMSGSGSIEGSQNMISAMLQRARSRAIGMQAPRGVFFYEDQASKRTAMLLVRIDEAGLNPNTDARVLELDDAAEEMQLLPANVGVAFLLGQKPGTSGMPAMTTYRPYGLIAFDGAGRAMLIPNYTMAPDTDAQAKKRYPPNGETQLADRFRSNVDDAILQKLGRGTVGDVTRQEFSHVSMMLFDKVPFSELTPSTDPTRFTTPVEVSGGRSQSEWLDANGVALAVNRYTGTILRAE